MDKTFGDKFNTTDTEDAMYNKLFKLIHYIAWANDNPDNVMMEAEDIASELTAEVVKGLKMYSQLPPNQLEAVLKIMVSHRMGELKYRYYGTHRAAAKLTVSLDVNDHYNGGRMGNINADGDGADKDDIEVEDEGPTPPMAVESMERVNNTRSKLGPYAAMVFDAVVLGKDPRLDRVMLMAMTRASTVYKNPHVAIKPRHVAEALAMPEAKVKSAFAEIKRTYEEVLQDEQ